MALGRLGDPNDGECVLVEAQRPRRPASVALLSFVPWGADGLSLDLMRRDRASDNGLIEFMVATLMREPPRLGRGPGVAELRDVPGRVRARARRIGAGPVLRLWRRAAAVRSRWWQLESLYRSNVKYQPQWVPRFLCFEDVRDLARVGMASAAPRGSWSCPTCGRCCGAAPRRPARRWPAGADRQVAV